MAVQTTAQARVIDPVLTTIARGYRNPMLASHHLFPIVLVSQRGGKIVAFNAEDFASINIQRAPGANRGTVEYGYSADAYALDQRALDGKVPIEILQDAQTVALDHQRIAVQKTMNIVMLQVEIDAATKATTATNYTGTHVEALSGNDQWSDDDSRPAKKIEDKKEIIATGVGMEPNILVVGPLVHRALRNHPDVIDRIKHTEGLSSSRAMPMVTDAKLSAYFGVEKYICAGARKGTPGNFSAVWGKNAVLAYSDTTPLASMGSPSFGYTYRLASYPIVAPGWLDRSCDSWRYPVTSEDTPVVAGKDAGYLLRTVVE